MRMNRMMMAVGVMAVALCSAGIASGAPAAPGLPDGSGFVPNKRGKGRGYQGRGYHQGRSIAKRPHLHIRERARRLHPPGDARRAFIAAETARTAH